MFCFVFVYYVWAEWKEERTPFPIWATKGKIAGNIAVLRQKSKLRGSVGNTNNTSVFIQRVYPSTSFQRAKFSFLPVVLPPSTGDSLFNFTEVQLLSLIEGIYWSNDILEFESLQNHWWLSRKPFERLSWIKFENGQMMLHSNQLGLYRYLQQY